MPFTRALSLLFVLVAGCSPSSSDGCAGAPDGVCIIVGTDARPLEDGGSSAADLSPQLDMATAWDGAQPLADLLPASDLAPLADLRPAPSDLACLPFVADPVTEQSCAPGQEQSMKTGPSDCYKKTCGCMNQATCSDCYWSSWTAVRCP